MLPEVEEIIEARAIALVEASLNEAGVNISVQGALSPVLAGEVRDSGNTYVSVLVDQQSQLADIKRSPAAWDMRIAVHIAMSDDPAGMMFVSACRAVRAAIAGTLGDACSAMSDAAAGFRCNAVELERTETPLDFGNEDEAFIKIYHASVAGRYTPQKGAN